MKKLSLAVAISMLASSPAFANDYQAELGFALGQYDAEAIDGNVSMLFGEVYFDKVDTSKGPLNEASFLSKSSGLFATYTDVEEADDNNLSLGGRFVFGSDYIIQASVSSADDSDTIGLGIGLYLNDTTDLVFSYANNDDEEVDSLAADLHSVIGLAEGASVALSLSTSYIDAANDSGFGIAGEIAYYFNNNFGVNAGVSTISIGDADEQEWNIGADWFVTDNLDFEVVYSASDVNDVEIDLFLAGLSFRF